MKNLMRLALPIVFLVVYSPKTTISAPIENWLHGAAGYDQAIKLQRELNVPLVVYFYTDWCPYCRTLDSQYLPSAPVYDYLRRVVKVRINPEHGPAERELARRYGVGGYPTFFIFRNRSAQPVSISPFRRIGNLTPTQFANACRAAAANAAAGLVLISNRSLCALGLTFSLSTTYRQ